MYNVLSIEVQLSSGEGKDTFVPVSSHQLSSGEGKDIFASVSSHDLDFQHTSLYRVQWAQLREVIVLVGKYGNIFYWNMDKTPLSINICQPFQL